ncbi:hypothetical protein Mapa_010062 [Marchantia paleacea]|nr:hypothetical protein Mapa_010062 [Marchantia paleacea]
MQGAEGKRELYDVVAQGRREEEGRGRQKSFRKRRLWRWRPKRCCCCEVLREGLKNTQGRAQRAPLRFRGPGLASVGARPSYLSAHTDLDGYDTRIFVIRGYTGRSERKPGSHGPPSPSSTD